MIVQRTVLRRPTFTVEDSRGGLYRFAPTTSSVGWLERHGRRWLTVETRADVSLGQMLLMATDKSVRRTA